QCSTELRIPDQASESRRLKPVGRRAGHERCIRRDHQRTRQIYDLLRVEADHASTPELVLERRLRPLPPDGYGRISTHGVLIIDSDTNLWREVRELAAVVEAVDQVCPRACARIQTTEPAIEPSLIWFTAEYRPVSHKDPF